MFLPLRNFGSQGVVHDTLAQFLPIGTWSDALNVRFTGAELQKMLEPAQFANYDGVNEDFYCRWLQPWSDGFSSYLAAVFALPDSGPEYLFFWVKRTENSDGVWSARGGPYTPGGNWQSFEWGNSCVFNNGLDAPQIWDESTKLFIDLPNWGLISTAQDILDGTEPSRDTTARATVLMPLRGFLVACGVTESGVYQPNKVWWSDAVTTAGALTAPSWDYESPSSLSGQAEVGLGDGKIRSAANLNENLIIYTDGSATAMQVVGGTIVMQFRRLFNKGAASVNTVAEFNNQHFVVARDQIYVHDGSTVAEIAKDRVEEEFFRRIGKGGRFGSGDVDWDQVQVIKNPDRKEIYVNYGGIDLNQPGDVGSGIPIGERNPPGLPEVGTGDPPTLPLKCIPYDCAALETLFASSGRQFINATGETLSTPFPFPGDGLNAFDSLGNQASYDFFNFELLAVPEDGSGNYYIPFDLCDIPEPRYYTRIRNLGGSDPYIEPEVTEIGDVSYSMIVGRAPLETTSVNDGTFEALNSGRSENYFEEQRNGVFFQLVRMETFVSIDDIGGGIKRITLQPPGFNYTGSRDGEFLPTTQATPITFDVDGDLLAPQNTWLGLSVDIKVTMTDEVPRPGANEFTRFLDTTFTVGIGDQTFDALGDSCIGRFYTGNNSTTSQFLTKEQAETLNGGPLFRYNRYLETANMSIAGYSKIGVPIADLQLALQRNHPDYTIPPECPNAV